MCKIICCYVSTGFSRSCRGDIALNSAFTRVLSAPLCMSKGSMYQ